MVVRIFVLDERITLRASGKAQEITMDEQQNILIESVHVHQLGLHSKYSLSIVTRIFY